MLCFLLLWERGASASNRRYKEHYSLWLLRSGDRLFPLQKTLLVTSSPKDLFRQSCSGFTDLRFVPTPHFLCSASLLALSLSSELCAIIALCFVLFYFFPWLHSGDFLSWIILALSLFVPTTQVLHFGLSFCTRCSGFLIL